MQDRYTGDIGDFGKFGLLRALVRENQETVRKLGVIWYLVPDETETTGGNLTAYLDDSAYGALDGDLHMLLRRIVNSGSRSVRLVEENGVLPPDTVFYRDPLDYGVGEPTTHAVQGKMAAAVARRGAESHRSLRSRLPRSRQRDCLSKGLSASNQGAEVRVP